MSCCFCAKPKKPEVLICFLACEDTPSRTMQKSEEVLAVVLAEEETKKQQVETKKTKKDEIKVYQRWSV